MKAVRSLALDSPAREIAREVLIRGPISRGELARKLGLSAASLTRLSKPLLEAGILQEGALLQAGGVGRPARPLDIRPDAHRFAGIKLTGESASAVATDLRCRTTASAEHPLTSHSVDDVVAAVAAVVAELGPVAGFSGIGISIGGKVGPTSSGGGTRQLAPDNGALGTGTTGNGPPGNRSAANGTAGNGVVQRAPFLQWRDVPLGRLVQERTGVPVALENDVVALTVAEQWFGAGRGIPNFAVLTIGAGVGYGLVINDRVIAPPDAGLGLAGHYPLDPSGPLCLEGHRGCSTSMLTMPGICAQVAAAVGSPVTYDAVLQLARESHPAAMAVASGAGTALGTLVAAIANLTMVELVVLSGEGMGLADVVPGQIEAAIRTHRDPEAQPVRLVREPADFGQWARGAAAVAIQRSIVGTLA